MLTRGTYNFEIHNNGSGGGNAVNLDKIRKLFRDGAIISGNWGPGDYGDFDNGSWHILCHLAGGAGVLSSGFGRVWCGITHVPAADTYQASVVYRRSGPAVTAPLAGEEGARLANGAQVLGYIE